MKVLLDTSALVAAMVEAHPAHARVVPWLEKAAAGSLELAVSAHTLAELYAVLTTLPTKPRIKPTQARTLIGRNVEDTAKIVTLTVAEYGEVLDRMTKLGLSGGVVYDALIARAAEKAGVDRLVTLNAADFRRVWSGVASVIVSA